jgi:predicted AAA+ superfamily ATPase
MAVTNHERVGKALDLLRDGLGPFVKRELKSVNAQGWFEELRASLSNTQLIQGTEAEPIWDVALLLSVMWDRWNAVFSKTLGRTERTLISELREVRNRWAHQTPFSSDDAYRALDSATRLLTSVSATAEAQEIEKAKTELLRVKFDEQRRSEQRKSSSSSVESQVTGTLKPWREVVSPHPDVASGRYQQAEFAADLWQVHIGEGSDEYRDPKEFFRRTFPTSSLQRLLVDATRRLSGNGGGDPVVQLQTNFGGGKTHSMLALYHLFSGAKPTDLLGVDAVMAEAGVDKLPGAVRRVVLVGNKISPGNPSKKPDGTVVRTIWGEIAWQLGGKKAYARIQADDERATSPGDVLRELFNEYGPALILIDEWVAYARQLHDQSDLPGGGFETQFSFAQALTESVKLADRCLLVVSLPASDTADGSPRTASSDDIEVGGQRGREALDRLRNVIGRVESSWRPASMEEGFEIVRRRLFEPLTDPDQYRLRDHVARTFYDTYRTKHQEFPPECRDGDYERRMQAAYPIHPEVFDRLYTDWSTLPKFQRTRGVLRLMAAVIHCLWDKGDRNPLIMPCHLPIDDPRVQFELTRYLSDNWVPVIEKDIDGPNALPIRIDAEVPSLGRFHACRRVARTIYLGSAPLTKAANRGLEDRRIKLGCVMPGEEPAVFGDALRRLASTATYLYPEGARYWYSTQPTVTKLAEDRAEQLKRVPDKIAAEIEKRLRADLTKHPGDFNRKAHIFPLSGSDVLDDLDARLVVLRSDFPYSKEPGNHAEKLTKEVMELRGNSPRIYRNALVFLAADKTKLQDLEDAVRHYLAWESIVDETDQLELTPSQVKQAEVQKGSASSVVEARIPESYQWLLIPVQNKPQDEVTWQATQLKENDHLAVRASKKLKKEELLVTSFSPSRLKMELDNVPLWRGDHVPMSQLFEDFAKYTYLPRLQHPRVLAAAIQDGLALLTWAQDSFAYADSYDEQAKRYRGLVYGRMMQIVPNSTPGLLVKPDVAMRQIEAETAPPPTRKTDPTPTGDGLKPQPRTVGVNGDEEDERPLPPPKLKVQPKRFHGSVTLDTSRVGRDASRVADEVLSHLSGLIGSNVKVTLEVEAEVPNGVTDEIIRIVTENARALKFDSQGFENE